MLKFSLFCGHCILQYWNKNSKVRLLPTELIWEFCFGSIFFFQHLLLISCINVIIIETIKLATSNLLIMISIRMMLLAIKIQKYTSVDCVIPQLFDVILLQKHWIIEVQHFINDIWNLFFHRLLRSQDDDDVCH